jgi:hypothetical protein
VLDLFVVLDHSLLLVPLQHQLIPLVDDQKQLLRSVTTDL